MYGVMEGAEEGEQAMKDRTQKQQNNAKSEDKVRQRGRKRCNEVWCVVRVRCVPLASFLGAPLLLLYALLEPRLRKQRGGWHDQKTQPALLGKPTDYLDSRLPSLMVTKDTLFTGLAALQGAQEEETDGHTRKVGCMPAASNALPPHSCRHRLPSSTSKSKLRIYFFALLSPANDTPSPLN